MSLHTDENLGVHHGRRRRLILEGNDIGIGSVTIAAGGSVTSSLLIAAGFVHFVGELIADTPVATTLVVRLVPKIAFFLINDEFTVATIATLVGVNRYSFYWGEARGLLTGALGTGSTWCFSAVFAIRIRNTGAQPANSVDVEQLECT